MPRVNVWTVKETKGKQVCLANKIINVRKSMNGNANKEV